MADKEQIAKPMYCFHKSTTGGYITKDGHTMFLEDVVRDLIYLQQREAIAYKRGFDDCKKQLDLIKE